MSNLTREIQKCRILAIMQSRAEGGEHDEQGCRGLWDLCGKPVLQWILEVVSACKYVDRLVVITTDRAVKKAVESYGVLAIDQPLYTSLDFPRDRVSGAFGMSNPRSSRSQIPEVYLGSFAYAHYWMKEKEGFSPDLILKVSDSFPMITTDIVNRVVEAFFKDKEATESGTFRLVHHSLSLKNPETGRMFPLLAPSFVMPRQRYLKTWTVGPLHLSGQPGYQETGETRIAPVFITKEEGFDIHDKEDLFLAQCYMERRLKRAREKKKKNKKEVDNG